MTDSKDNQIICAKCKKQITSDSKFCPECGCRLISDTKIDDYTTETHGNKKETNIITKEDADNEYFVIGFVFGAAVVSIIYLFGYV